MTLLQYDHGIARQVLDVVGELLRSQRAQKHPSEFQEAIAFLEQFLDRFHHAKEEMFLFPAAAEEFPRMTETLDRLKRDHAQARKMMRAALSAMKKGDMVRAEKEARSLVDHMTVHISQEENNVFPAIEGSLQLETDARLHAQYEMFMEKEFGKGYYQVAESFANDIQDRLLGPGFFKGIV